jgi:hypothetical protein
MYGFNQLSALFRGLIPDMVYYMRNVSRCLVNGAIAGAIGVFLMDRFTWAFYRNEDPEAYRKEKKAQVAGRYAPNTAGKQLTEALGVELPGRKQYIVGRSIHYLMGMASGALYALTRHHADRLGTWRGPLYGFGLFITFDEGIVPLLDYASGPTAYPWQAHARGFVAHLILGATTDAVLNLLEEPK